MYVTGAIAPPGNIAVILKQADVDGMGICFIRVNEHQNNIQLQYCGIIIYLIDISNLFATA